MMDNVTLVFVVVTIFLVIFVGGVFFILAVTKPRNLPPDHWSKISDEEAKAELKQSWNNLKTAYKNLSPEERDQVHKIAGSIVPTEFVLTAPNCVVTYQPAAFHGLISHLFNRGKIEQQIRDILASNPDADLTKYEQALGIKIIDVQRRGQDNKTPGVWI